MKGDTLFLNFDDASPQPPAKEKKREKTTKKVDIMQNNADNKKQ